MGDWGARKLDQRLGEWLRAKLPHGLAELVIFVLKQCWAALFGGLFLIAILFTKAIWQPDWALARYDALFLFALITQALMLISRLETLAEARVILLFHLTGTAMEIFKISAGSWAYPEAGLFKLMGVPLFSGFMYASIGSYMARVIRIFGMQFAPYPPYRVTVLFGVVIYLNFFAHHYLSDIRLALFVGTLILFARTRIWFYIGDTPRWMPLPIAAFFSSFFIWLAENVGTFTGTWAYPGQSALEVVNLAKMGSWYLLLYVAFVTVTLVYRDMLYPQPLRPQPLSDQLGRKQTTDGARLAEPAE